jgi:hypothetical protein
VPAVKAVVLGGGAPVLYALGHPAAAAIWAAVGVVNTAPGRDLSAARRLTGLHCDAPDPADAHKCPVTGGEPDARAGRALQLGDGPKVRKIVAKGALEVSYSGGFGGRRIGRGRELIIETCGRCA